MTLTSGVRLGAYEIVELLGAGGMGEVYRARDVRLDRTVVVKVLASGFATNAEWRQRFDREARLISTLGHPHICTLFDVGEQDGVAFLVMEHLEGETLAARLGRGAVPLDQALTLAIQIAEALTHAHERGVVHRDVKPGNVMLTPLGAKLLDFGLAKAHRIMSEAHAVAVSEQPTELRNLTEHGVLIGTVRYMAPEQLEGKEADTRSDVFAFGALLYELLSGRAAFEGASQATIIAAIMAGEPPPVSAITANTPRELNHLIQRCLAKNPNDRWQTMRDVAAELKWIAANYLSRLTQSRDQQASAVARGSAIVRRPRLVATVLFIIAAVTAVGLIGRDSAVARRWLDRAFAPLGRAAIQSLAVLPLRNLSRDPEQEYFADGMTEALITDLSKLGTSRVISRGSIMQYKNANKPIAEIARELNVDALVDGSVMRAGNRVRISAQLVEAATDQHLWADAYERELRDVFVLQEQVAQAIAQEIGGRLRPASASPRRVRTTMPDVYELYLKGRYSWNKYSEEGWKEALDYFTKAVSLDRTFAPAWSGIADTYYGMSSIVLPASEAIPRAREAAVTALAIDDTVAEAHASLGLIKAQYDWDRPGAERDLKRAIALDPNYAMAHHALGLFYYTDAQFEQAFKHFELARHLDPLSIMMGASAVWPLPHLGREAEALERLEHLTQLHPDVADLEGFLHESRAESYLQKGMNDEAVAEFLQGFNARLLTGGDAKALNALKQAYASSGFPGYWRKQLELADAKYRIELEQAQKQSPTRYVSVFELARLHARVGDVDGAFALLNRGLQNRDERMTYLKAEAMRANSPWTSTRSDPRFNQVLVRLGVQPLN